MEPLKVTLPTNLKELEEIARAYAVFYHISKYLETKDPLHIDLLKKSISIGFNIPKIKKSTGELPMHSESVFDRYYTHHSRPKILF